MSVVWWAAAGSGMVWEERPVQGSGVPATLTVEAKPVRMGWRWHEPWRVWLPAAQPPEGARPSAEVTARDVGLPPPPGGRLRLSTTIRVGRHEGTVMLYEASLPPHGVPRWYGACLGNGWVVEDAGDALLWIRREREEGCVFGFAAHGLAYVGMMVEGR